MVTRSVGYLSHSGEGTGNRDMEEKGLLPGVVHRSPAAHWGSAGDNNRDTVLHVSVQSGLKIDVEVEEPETSENPTQSLAVIIYRTVSERLFN